MMLAKHIGCLLRPDACLRGRPASTAGFREHEPRRLLGN
jgi:hypothetical protein